MINGDARGAVTADIHAAVTAVVGERLSGGWDEPNGLVTTEPVGVDHANWPPGTNVGRAEYGDDDAAVHVAAKPDAEVWVGVLNDTDTRSEEYSALVRFAWDERHRVADDIMIAVTVVNEIGTGG